MPTPRTPTRHHERLKQQTGFVGWTLGQMEALAGINPQNDAERTALWRPFVMANPGGDSELINAVADYCAQRTFARVKAGELCLLQRHHLYRH